ncbi:MAG: hypothetical protein IKB36_00800 [Clostridia bacterium]|nr:hypothetical protein [Clostridia bacterium]
MDEKNLNPQKEDISSSYNDIFDYNVVDVEPEMMNRDYLNQIYDDDMESLNKVVLLTRTQHFKRVEETKKSYEKEINWSKKLLTVSGIILAVFIGVAISFYAQGLNFYEIFFENMSNIKSYNNGEINGYDTNTLRGMWQIFGLSGLVGSVFLFIGGLQFFFLGYGNIKRIKKLKKTRESALQKLEDAKKEHMLAGTYDASK